MVAPRIIKMLSAGTGAAAVGGVALAFVAPPAGVALLAVAGIAGAGGLGLAGFKGVGNAVAANADGVQYLDPETGLGTSHQMSLVWKEHIGRYQRYRKPFSMAVIEVQYTRPTLRSVPSEVIIELARRLKVAARGEDTVVRVSNRRFAVLLSECDEAGARIFLERVRQEAERLPFRTEGGTRYLEAVGGVAQWGLRMDTMEDLQKAAHADAEQFAVPLIVEQGPPLALAS